MIFQVIDPNNQNERSVFVETDDELFDSSIAISVFRFALKRIEKDQQEANWAVRPVQALKLSSEVRQVMLTHAKLLT
jgi:hypothetical protein